MHTYSSDNTALRHCESLGELQTHGLGVRLRDAVNCLVDFKVVIGRESGDRFIQRRIVQNLVRDNVSANHRALHLALFRFVQSHW